jgi:hypothetical protein
MDFVNSTVLAPCNMFCISLLIHILHRSPPFTVPFSFPKIYSSCILIAFVFPVVVVQAYDPQVSVVRAREVTCLMNEKLSHTLRIVYGLVVFEYRLLREMFRLYRNSE